MTTPDRPQSGGAPVQPWTPGAAPKGVTCPACGLANEAGARTCRNCGLPIASEGDPVRGVAPGRVDLPRTRRSGFSATVGFVLVVALLLVGGSLAVTGGGGILSGGGRFFAEATPTPSPTPVSQEVVGVDASADTGAGEEVTVPKATTANMKTYSCENEAIKDLSRGRWFLTDVKAAVREAEDGTTYDQIYWRLDRQNPGKKVKAGNATTVSMKWTTPDAAKEKYGDAIGRVQGDKAIEIVFDGPMQISANGLIEQSDFEEVGIEQLRRVQLFESKNRVRTVIGLKGDACARLGSVQWGAKSKKDNARVVLDVERFD